MRPLTPEEHECIRLIPPEKRGQKEIVLRLCAAGFFEVGDEIRWFDNVDFIDFLHRENLQPPPKEPFEYDDWRWGD